MEGAVVRFLVPSYASAAGLAVASLLAGCSSPPPPRVWEGQAGSPRTGSSAQTGRSSERLVPDVTTPPRPFRLSPEVRAALDVASSADALPAAVSLIGQSSMSSPAWRSPPADAVPRDFDPADVTAPLRATPPPPPEVAEIRGMMRDYHRAFNRHDPAALAAHWTGGGESIDLVSGDATAGREAVRSVFAALFEQDDSATIDIDVLQVRPIRDDVAVVDGLTRIAFSDTAPAASRFTAVVVKEEGRWLLESVRETALPADAAEAPGRPLDALGWLVGAWENVGGGVIASADCTWSAGRGFLVRSHAIRGEAPGGVTDAADGSIPGLLAPGAPQPREITEIVGWDPDRRVIRSWVFTSAGRFAEGTWERDGDAWMVHYEGRGRDEGLSSVCRMSPGGFGAGGSPAAAVPAGGGSPAAAVSAGVGSPAAAVSAGVGSPAAAVSAGVGSPAAAVSAAADTLVIVCDGDALADLLPPACEFLRTARLD